MQSGRVVPTIQEFYERAHHWPRCLKRGPGETNSRRPTLPPWRYGLPIKVMASHTIPTNRKSCRRKNNSKHCRERSIGQWKRRVQAFSAGRTCRVIVACAVLHNLAKQRGLPEVEVEDDMAMERQLSQPEQPPQNQKRQHCQGPCGSHLFPNKKQNFERQERSITYLDTYTVMDTYNMYNTTPTRSTQHARFGVTQASFSPGFAGTASGEIEAFIWRCKQDNNMNTGYKSASRELDSSSVTTFINMLTEVNKRCCKLEDQLLHLQEHTRRVTSQLDSIVSHHGDNKLPTSTAHSSTSSMDTMKAIRKLQWKIFDLQRENEALRGVLEMQRVKVDAEGEVACPQEEDPSEPWSYLESEETSTPSERSAFMQLDPSIVSDHKKADRKKEDVTSKEARQQSTPSSGRRVVQQRLNYDQQNQQPTPLLVQQGGYSEKQQTQSTPEPSSADQRIVVDQQLNCSINRNSPSISNSERVDKRLVQKMVISDDTKLVHNIEHPHNGIDQKNTCGGMKSLKDKWPGPGATSTPTRNSSYRPTKLTQSGKEKYHYSRPPVGREEWRWSSPSTSYPQVSTKSSTKTENTQGIQSCYQTTPKSYYGDPHSAGAEHREHLGNISTLKDVYGRSNPDNVSSSDCGRTPCPNELGDLELGEFNLYASPEDIRLVQGTLELLSTINNMGFNEEVTT